MITGKDGFKSVIKVSEFWSGWGKQSSVNVGGAVKIIRLVGEIMIVNIKEGVEVEIELW
jgi:hypothetical protein